VEKKVEIAMDEEDLERVKASLNALEKLRQAEPMLSAQQKQLLAPAREAIHKGDLKKAKAIVVSMLEVSKMPDELGEALVNICLALGEKDIGPLADYLCPSPDPEE
jgi:hypothetical protein